MFEKLKQIGKLKEMQKSLEEDKIKIEKKGLNLVINGNFKIVSLTLNPELGKEEQERILKDCFNEGIDKIKSLMAQKLQSIL
jgi:DNA-binding protein YbaB